MVEWNGRCLQRATFEEVRDIIMEYMRINVCVVYFPGDEVVEWNGRCLQRATFEEVRDIIMESKQEPRGRAYSAQRCQVYNEGITRL